MEKYLPSSYQQIQKGIALETLGRIPEARVAWLLAGKMVPALIRPHYLLAKSYNASGEREQAIRHARIVLTKEIKVYTPEVYYMKQEMKKMID